MMLIHLLPKLIAIYLFSLLADNEISDTKSEGGDYHYEKHTTTDVGDDILARYASDANSPIRTWTRASAVKRSNAPQQHEWESLATISNIAENFKVKESYTLVIVNGKAKLPKNYQSFQFDGKFSYSVSSRNKGTGIKNINLAIRKCIAGSMVVAEKKCSVFPIFKVADTFLPYTEHYFPPAE